MTAMTRRSFVGLAAVCAVGAGVGVGVGVMDVGVGVATDSLLRALIGM